MNNMLVFRSRKVAFVVLTLGLFFSSLSAYAGLKISNVETTTHYPWNGVVDVKFDLSEFEDDTTYSLKLSVVAGETSCFSTNILVSAKIGEASKTYNLSLNVKNYFNGRAEDATVEVLCENHEYVVIDLSNGPNASSYPVSYLLSLKDYNVDEFKTNKLLLKRVKSGAFDKLVGVFEVTQRQYELVVGSNPSYFTKYNDASVSEAKRQLTEYKRPVERVSYADLMGEEGFFKLLRQRIGNLPLSLPSVSDWRTVAGVSVPSEANMRCLVQGKLLGNEYSGANLGTAMVGSYPANNSGIYDIYGNVSEWTTGVATNQETNLEVGILCGGSYVDFVKNFNKATTKTLERSLSNYSTGFRIYADFSSLMASKPFVLDVDSDGVRSARWDENKGFFYTPEGGEEIPWAEFDEGDKSWRPTHYGDNVATNIVKLGEVVTTNTATFNVDALAVSNIVVKFYAPDELSKFVDGTNFTYNAAPHWGVVECELPKAADRVIMYGTSADDISSEKPIVCTNAANYTIWYTISSPFYATVTNCFNFTIDPIDISTATIVVSPEIIDLPYNGAIQKPAASNLTQVLVNDLPMSKFSLGTKGMTDAGDSIYKIISEDQNFTGTKTGFKWKISPLPIDGMQITLTTNLVWNGEADWAFKNQVFTRTIKVNPSIQTQQFEVVNAKLGTSLKKGTDYTVEGDSDQGLNAGAYTLKVKGVGNYKDSATKVWTIVPTIPMVYPNKMNPGLTEEWVVEAETRVAVGRNADPWGVKWHSVAVTTGEESSGVSDRNTAATLFPLLGDERIIFKAWAYVRGQENVTSEVVQVDYKAGRAAKPVVVLSDKNNVPYLDDKGYPLTNDDGSVITNFFHNGQRIVLTRGNVVVSNLVGGVRQAYTNNADKLIYTDGSFRYTLDGTIPTMDSCEWTAKSEIIVTNDTTIISRVFGKECADSWVATNVFVREYEQYAPPKVECYKEGGTDWSVLANGEEVSFKKAGLPVRLTDTNDSVEVKDDTRQIWWSADAMATTNRYIQAFAISNTVELIAWIGDKNGEYIDSAPVTNRFVTEEKLTAPTIAFSNAVDIVRYQKDSTTFTNAYQWVSLTRPQTEHVYDTDGEIWYKTDDCDWNKYTEPFQIWSNATVYAVATNGISGISASDVSEKTFKQELKPIDDLQILINDTRTVKYYEVKISCPTAAAAGYVTYYTLDGSAPVGINGKGLTPSASFTGVAFTTNVYVEAGAKLVVKAKTYFEVDNKRDYIEASAEVVKERTRDIRIGDYLRPGVEEPHTDAPSTADLDVRSDAGDGYNTIWQDDSVPPKTFDSSWTNDNKVAYVSGGKSMRSGRVRDAVGGVTTGTNSVMTAKVFGPGTLSFQWKASTEFDPNNYEANVFDYCELLVDGKKTGFITYGTNDWSEVTFAIEESDEKPKSHTITWNYIKDEGQYDEETLGCKIEDCVWVDEFTWSAAPRLDQMTIDNVVVYGGSAKLTPTFTATLDGKVLSNNVDFVAVATPTNEVGTYEYTLTAKGKTCTGTVSGNWEMIPLSLTNAVVTLSDGQIYTGDTQYAIVKKIMVGTVDVTDAYSWSVEGTNEVERGTYTATITGYGNLTGIVSTNWVINPRSIVNTAITIPDLVYNRNVQAPKVTVDDTAEITAADYDYTIEPAEVMTAGVYTVTFTGKNNYAGTTNITFNVKKAVVDSVELDDPYEFTYNGGVHKVTAIAKSNELELSADEFHLNQNGSDTDSAINAGIYYASVILKDTNNFELKDGRVAEQWKINPLDVSQETVSVALNNDLVYKAAAQKVEKTNVKLVTVKGLTVPADSFTINCPEQTDANTYNDGSITCSSNYTGTATFEWSIKPRDITGATVTFTKDPLDWTGSELTVAMKDLTVDGITFKSDDTTFTYSGDKATDAGEHTITVNGSKNFEKSTTATWQIKPKSPEIKPNNGGAYSKVAKYITVEITCDNADWTIEYTTDGGATWKDYPQKSGKFDIEKRTIVGARTISKDGKVKSDIVTVEYYFGGNIDPKIALYAENEAATPTDALVKGEGKLIWNGTAGKPYENFYHSSAKVNITRFGTMSSEEIIDATNKTTYVVGETPVCPYTDGEVWYTMVEGETAALAPTNAPGFGSTKFDPADKSTWPVISTNATIVARVFGKLLGDGQPITNKFTRIWTKMPEPTMTADPGATFQFTNTITLATNDYTGVDATVTNAFQKLYYTLDGSTPTKDSTLYTAPIELTAKDCTDGKVTVKAVSYYGEDYLYSDVVENEYTHYTTQYTTPTLTPSATFDHHNDEFGVLKGYEVALTNVAPSEAGGELQYSYDGTTWVKYEGSLWITDTTNVYARVYAPDTVTDYTTSEVAGPSTFTYAPKKFNMPTIIPNKDASFNSKISVSLSRGIAPECGHHGVIYYTLDGSDPLTSETRNIATTKTTILSFERTTTLRAVEAEAPGVPKDHLDSDEASYTYTRVVLLPNIKLVDADGNDAPVEIEGGKTNFYHKCYLLLTNNAKGAELSYSSAELGSGTYTDKIPVSDTFTVTATATLTDVQQSVSVTATFTRKWETLSAPIVKLVNPEGVVTNEFRHSGDTVFVTNDFANVTHDAAKWPTNATLKVAVGDAPTAADWVDYELGKTILNANTKKVWAAVAGEDYLPSTNSVVFTRKVDELATPTISLESPTSRTNVVVSFVMPAGANAIWYTYVVTNDDAVVALTDPIGEEYDKTSAAHLASSLWTNACDNLNVAIKPHQKVAVKAIAYFEEDDGVAACITRCFTAKSGIANSEKSLEWTIADGLDLPDWGFGVSTSGGSKAKIVEENNIKTFGDSSICYTNAENNAWLSVSTEVKGPGVVVFDWKTLCEKGPHDFNYDHMTFYVNDTPICKLDGDSGWQTVTNRINGAMDTINVLKWVYEKDDSEHLAGGDCAWLDNLRWTPEKTQLKITEELGLWLTDKGVDPADESKVQAKLAETAKNGRSYWECYVLGLDVEDETDDFVAGNPEKNEKTGVISVTFNKRVAGRTYTLVGKKNLGDSYWVDLAVMEATTTDLGNDTTISTPAGTSGKGYSFFVVRVKMTQE